MNRRYVFGAGVLVTLLIGAWLTSTSLNSGPIASAPQENATDNLDNPSAADEPSDAQSSARGTTARAGKAPANRGFNLSAPPGAIGPSTRAFASPEEASSFVEDRVLDLFAAVSPEIDSKTIHKSCEPDGRTCTFDGPWPGDDFLGRWLRAISEDRTGLEALDGVRFSEFKPVDTDGERRFRLKAHAP